jgi:hypothetical protein
MFLSGRIHKEKVFMHLFIMYICEAQEFQISVFAVIFSSIYLLSTGVRVFSCCPWPWEVETCFRWASLAVADGVCEMLMFVGEIARSGIRKWLFCLTWKYAQYSSWNNVWFFVINEFVSNQISIPDSYKEMLTNALGALVKELNMVSKSWNLCILLFKISKCLFQYEIYFFCFP